MKIVSKTGMTMISGQIKEPDVKYVGDNQTLLVKLGVRVYNEKVDGQWKSEWSNVDCWGDVAEMARDLEKGDVVFVCGIEQIREYNGKTYSTVKADFMSVMPRYAVSASTPQAASAAMEIDDDGELPF